MPSFLVSSQCLAASTIDEALRVVPLSFDGIEMGAGLRTCGKSKLNEWLGNGRRAIVHNYFPPPVEPFVLNLASSDETILARSKALCRAALVFCSEHSIPLYGVHAGFCVHARPQDLGKGLRGLERIPKSVAQKIFVQSLKEIGTYAKSLGVGLAVENNVVTSENLIQGKNELLLGAHPEELAGLIAQTGDKEVSILLDLGHLKVTSRTLGFDIEASLRPIQGMVRVVHASDNDGQIDAHAPFSGPPWFSAMARRWLQSVEYVVLETSCLRTEILGEQATLLRHIWE